MKGEREREREREGGREGEGDFYYEFNGPIITLSDCIKKDLQVLKVNKK